MTLALLVATLLFALTACRVPRRQVAWCADTLNIRYVTYFTILPPSLPITHQLACMQRPHHYDPANPSSCCYCIPFLLLAPCLTITASPALPRLPGAQSTPFDTQVSTFPTGSTCHCSSLAYRELQVHTIFPATRTHYYINFPRSFFPYCPSPLLFLFLPPPIPFPSLYLSLCSLSSSRKFHIATSFGRPFSGEPVLTGQHPTSQ